MARENKKIDSEQLASEIDAGVRMMPEYKVACFRPIRRKYSKVLKDSKPREVLRLTQRLLDQYDQVDTA